MLVLALYVIDMAMPAGACLQCSVAQRSRPIPLSVSPNSDESGKQSLYPDGDPDRQQNLIVCASAIANLPWKFRANAFGRFSAKLLTNRQTDRQTTTKT